MKLLRLSYLYIFAIFLLAGTAFGAMCWDYGGNQGGCENSSDTLNCIWYDAGESWCPSGGSGCCEQLGCWVYDGDKTTCQASTMGCSWNDNQYNQNMWCPVSSSNPYKSDGTPVSGTDIGCCSQPGCWDRDGTTQSYCENASFMDGICSWKTQAEDPWCPNSGGCCMMKFCSDVTTEADCDALISKGQPCSWSGSACTDPGFGGYSGADTCVESGGFWNSTGCETPTYGDASNVHCWFADYMPATCGNITGCVYCNSTNTQQAGSICNGATLRWCNGHESTPGSEGLPTDAVACEDINIKGSCDCGPVPGCRWTNSSATVGAYCAEGVSDCSLNFETLAYDQCTDAPNEGNCTMLKNTYMMPCKFNLSGSGECEFDWQSGGGFGDSKGSTNFEFEDIMDSQSCQFAGGIWETVEIDSYGNTQGWCEFGFGAGMEECADSCWACELQDDGQPWASAAAAQSACEGSAAGGGGCQFVTWGGTQDPSGRWGWCDFPMEMNFCGGGNCESNCFDCFNQDMCSSSTANCSWVTDPMGFGSGWCDPAAVAAYMNCSSNALACWGESQCASNGYNWTNTYVTDPFSGTGIWACIENGTTPEVCYIPGDEDADGAADCQDSDCSNDPMCGFGMGGTGPGGPGEGSMLPPGMESTVCFAYDDTNQSACEALIVTTAFAYNGTHRGVAGLPDHLNNTQLCFYHSAPPGADETNWCDPIFDKQMTGGDMGKPPTMIGTDDASDASGFDHLDIVHVGIMDMPQTMDLGMAMTNATGFAVCEKLGGKFNGTVFRYIDSDTNTSTGCTATDGTYDGFDFKLVLRGTYNGTDSSVVTAAYRCLNSTAETWTTKSASLTVVEDTCFISQMPGETEMANFNGVTAMSFKKSEFGIATNDLRIFLATAANGYNETNTTDEAGPYYYTPGSIDFIMEDCFGFSDMDGDGLTPSQDPDCKFIKNLGFIPAEICDDNIDNNGDNVVDCDDPMCTYKPKCGGTFNYTPSSTDTTAPNVIFHTVETFHDGAFVKFDTNEPANGTVYFYGTDSGCTTLNKTIYDIGDPYCTTESWCAYDDYKLWHEAPIDNFGQNYYNLGYGLLNGTAYYYKYKVCDPTGNCGQSACSNFTTEASVKEFYFGMDAPAGFTVKTPWAENGQNYSTQVNSSQTKDINITIECATAGYSLKLVGADVKSAKDFDFTNFTCDTTNKVIGISSSVWDQLLFDLSVDYVEITWAITGTNPVVYHCALGGTSCTDVTTVLDCTNSSTSITCRVPTTMGFSSYKVTTTTPTTTSSGGGGGGGGGGSSNTLSQSKSVSSIAAGGSTKFDYTKAFGIISIEVSVSSAVGSSSVSVEDKTSNPGVSTAAIASSEGKIYKYLEIKPSSNLDSSLSEAKIQFKVPKSSVGSYDVELRKYKNGVWQSLTTTKYMEDGINYYYQATSDSFSMYAITLVKSCIERWLCDAWSDCTSGQQTRLCADMNSCGTVVDKPVESRSCEEVIVEEPVVEAPAAPLSQPVEHQPSEEIVDAAVTETEEDESSDLNLLYAVIIVAIIGGVLIFHKVHGTPSAVIRQKHKFGGYKHRKFGVKK